MPALEAFFRRKQAAALARESFDREVGRAVFEEWRDRYIATLAAYIRTHREARLQGLKAACAIDPSPEWCNAAIQVLSVGDLELQDFFLRADPDEKNKIVHAVLIDKGVTRMDGFFAELPPL